MYQLHLGISEDLEKALRAFADTRGISIAAAVRILLHDALTIDRAATENPEEIPR